MIDVHGCVQGNLRLTANIQTEVFYEQEHNTEECLHPFCQG